MDVIQRINSGDTAAFKKIFDEFYPDLCRFSLRFLKDPQSTENVVQEVFLKIWINRENWNPTVSVKSYLYTAVKNQSLNYLKSKQAYISIDTHLNLCIESPDDPESDLMSKEFSEAVELAISELPEGCRIIYSMSRTDGMTYKEIAKILHLSIKTVETQMGRALRYLRSRLSSFLFSLLV